MSYANYRDLETEIVRWAEARKIIPNSTPTAQLLKAFEEMGELAAGEARNNMDLIEDSVGDLMVCIINYCALRDISVEQCMLRAWNEIKDRKGYMNEQGFFVKEEK